MQHVPIICSTILKDLELTGGRKLRTFAVTSAAVRGELASHSAVEPPARGQASAGLIWPSLEGPRPGPCQTADMQPRAPDPDRQPRLVQAHIVVSSSAHTQA